ncbi:MAG: cytosine deaminase [Leptolyngbya sp. Prado105]|jgi:uncharacterized SAM-binding protein YcdF (DUF218 family)|nr:cytosine deaminase [Leptolyngbya sp. Prado105]
MKLRFVQRRETWVLTFYGWLLVLTCSVVILFGFCANLHRFFAISEPIQAEALVVEGWLEDKTVTSAIAEFNTRNYKVLITTGIELPIGYYLSGYKTFAEVSAATLKQAGFNPGQLVVVPAKDAKRDRTFTAALALKDWLDQSPIRSINLYSSGTHARRSRMLYQRALGQAYQIGVIAADDPEYETRDWWKSSAGVKKVLIELVSYVYTIVFNRE